MSGPRFSPPIHRFPEPGVAAGAFFLALALAGSPRVAQAAARYGEPSTPDSVVARVGERVLSLGYYAFEWNRLLPNQRPQHADPKRAREIFLDDLVFRHLLALAALPDTRPLPPEQEAGLIALREETMRNRLYARVIVEPVRVDQVDLDLFVAELTKLLELRAYVFPEQEAAQAWYSRLVAGTPISRLEEAARQADPEVLQRIDYGYVGRSDMRDSLARVVYRLPPGRVSPPTPLGGRWGLYQVASQREVPPGVDLSDQEAVFRKAREFRVIEAREAYRESLRDSLHLEYEGAALDTLVNRFLAVPSRSSVSPGGTPTFNIFLPLPAISEEDSALVLARFGDHVVTGSQVFRYLRSLGAATRPEIQTREDLIAVVDRVAFDGALLERAYAMGLGRDDEVVAVVERRREGLLVERMFADSVTSRVQMHTDTLRIFYDQNRAHFDTPAKARAWLLVAPSRALAESLLAVARGGADLGELARVHSIQEGAAENGGMAPEMVRGDSPNGDLEEAIFSTAVGEFGGPVQTQDAWVIFRVEDRKEEVVADFEAALIHVSDDYRRAREERELELFLARLEKQIPVQSFPERVRNLKL